MLPHGTSEQLAQELDRMLTTRIAANQLALPAAPGVALKCLNGLKTPGFSLTEAAAIIDKDPVLAAQVLRITNNAALATREPVRSVLAGVTRLGTVRLRTVLIESSARQVFTSRDPRIGAAIKGVWEHSLAVAVLARELTVKAGAGDPEFGYLGGLMHDIGKPVVATMLLEAEKLRAGRSDRDAWLTSDEWIGVVQHVHRKIGVLLAKKWEMPDAVTCGIRDCDAYDETDKRSLANVVRLANALAKQAGIYVGAVSSDDVQAHVDAGRALLGLDAAVTDALCIDLKARVQQALQ